MIDSRLDFLIGWRCLIAAPGLARGRRGALFEPPAGCSLPLQPFSYIQLGPVFRLIRILCSHLVKPSVIFDLSILVKLVHLEHRVW